MIKINLSIDSKIKTFVEILNNYYLFVSPIVIQNSEIYLQIHNYYTGVNLLPVLETNANSLKAAIKVLCGGEIKNDGLSLDKRFPNNRKVFLDSNKPSVIYGFWNSNKKKKKKYLELLHFLSGKQNINNISLRELLISSPAQLEVYNSSLVSYFNILFRDDTFSKVILDILDYSILHKNINIKKLYEDNFEVEVCPYCNRNYISFIEHELTKIIGPTYDHFLPKSEFMFLCASFYNLIPSCFVCNSNLKNKQKIINAKYLNPYIDGFGSAAKFSANFQLSKYAIKLEYDYSQDKTNKILSQTNSTEGNVSLFKIEEIYNLGHQNEIKLIINNCEKLNSYFHDNLKHILGDNCSSEEFYLFYFQNYLNEIDFNKKPLSKLTRDLVDERLKWIL